MSLHLFAVILTLGAILGAVSVVTAALLLGTARDRERLRRDQLERLTRPAQGKVWP